MVSKLMEAVQVTPSETCRRSPGILIVDDAEIVRAVLSIELELRGVNIWQASNGNDAFDLFRLHRDEIDLVLLDVQLPGMDGPQILAALQLLDPNVLACFMTGDPSAYSQRALLQCGALRVFAKPCGLGLIADFVEMTARQNCTDYDGPWSEADENDTEMEDD